MLSKPCILLSIVASIEGAFFNLVKTLSKPCKNLFYFTFIVYFTNFDKCLYDNWLVFFNLPKTFQKPSKNLPKTLQKPSKNPIYILPNNKYLGKHPASIPLAWRKHPASILQASCKHIYINIIFTAVNTDNKPPIFSKKMCYHSILFSLFSMLFFAV